MKLSIPANWQDDFFEKIDFSNVAEVYGKLPGDYIGGGRASVIFKKVSNKKFKDHVGRIRGMGISFNYLLNATCLDNLEFTRKGSKRIIKLLDLVVDAGANWLTVALPQLIPMIRSRYPEIKISVSTNNMVDNLERVRYWEDFGIDKITLSYTDVNRNFKELKRIVAHKKCEVQLICNLLCRKHCPFQAQHANFHSHASQTGHVNKRLPMDYFCTFCLVRNFSNPYDIIRAPWIRPEDLEFYEKIGIDHFKLTERGMNTDDLALIVKAYSERSYDGEFMDLFPSMHKYIYISEPDSLHNLKYFGRIGKLPLKMIRSTLGLFKSLKQNASYYKNLGISVDNKKLDGFAKYFVEHSCYDKVCEECEYCDLWAKKVIKVKNPQNVKKALNSMKAVMDESTSLPLRK